MVASLDRALEATRRLHAAQTATVEGVPSVRTRRWTRAAALRPSICRGGRLGPSLAVNQHPGWPSPWSRAARTALVLAAGSSAWMSLREASSRGFSRPPARSSSRRQLSSPCVGDRLRPALLVLRETPPARPTRRQCEDRAERQCAPAAVRLPPLAAAAAGRRRSRLTRIIDTPPGASRGRRRRRRPRRSAPDRSDRASPSARKRIEHVHRRVELLAQEVTRPTGQPSRRRQHEPVRCSIGAVAR